MLTSLLTSPSASINLASSTNSAYSGKLNSSSSSNKSGAGTGSYNHSSTNSGSVKMSTTSSIQGICNKQASRALLVLVYPEMPVSYHENINVGKHYVKNISNNIGTVDPPVAEKSRTDTDVNVKNQFSALSERTLHLDAATATMAPLLTKTPLSVSPHKIRLAPLAHSNNNNNASAHEVATTAELATQPATPNTLRTNTTSTATTTITADTTPVQLRAPMISPLFLTDTAARPWLFSYFYKSGAVKDQFTAYLRFVPVYTTVSPSSMNLTSIDSKDTNVKATTESAAVLVGAEVHGRGIDNIGAFTLTGKAQADINGWTWHVDKCYVPVTFDTGSVYLDTLHGVDNEQVNGHEGSALHWVQGVDREVALVSDNTSCGTCYGGHGNSVNTNTSNSSSSRATVHVRHVAYWSPGVQNTTYTDFNSSTTHSASASAAKADHSVENTNTSSAVVMNSAATVSTPAASELNHIDEEPTGIW